MYGTLLYPTDGSTGSEAAVDHVRELADRFDATVHVLSVVDTRDVGFGMAGNHHTAEEPGLSGDHIEGGGPGMEGERVDPDERRATVRERGREVVADAADRLGDVDTTTVVESGNPHEEILEYAADNDVDLVVMGTHGRTGVDRYLLGSVTEKVVRLSDAPVVTVRNDD